MLSEGVPQDPAGCPRQWAQKKQETDRWQRHETDRWNSKATGSWPISCDALRPSTPPPPHPSFSSKLPGGHQPSLAHLCFGTSRPGLTEGMGQLHAPQGHSSQRPGPWAMMSQPGAANMLQDRGQAAPARHACSLLLPFPLVLSGSLSFIPISNSAVARHASLLCPRGNLAFPLRARSSHTETHIPGTHPTAPSLPDM